MKHSLSPKKLSRLGKKLILHWFLKCYCDQKNNSHFLLDFKIMLIKHWLTQVLSSDFKKTPVYFSWNFLIYKSAITNFKILRELGRGENDVKDSLVMQCVCTQLNQYAAWEIRAFRLLNPCFAYIINCVCTLNSLRIR